MPNRMNSMMRLSSPPKTLGGTQNSSSNLYNMESQMLSNIYQPFVGYPICFYGRNDIPDLKPLSNLCNNSITSKDTNNINQLDIFTLNYNINQQNKDSNVNITISMSLKYVKIEVTSNLQILL